MKISRWMVIEVKQYQLTCGPTKKNIREQYNY